MADVTTPLEGDLGWMLGVVFRAYAKAAEHALRDLPGGPRGYQVLTAAVGSPPRNQGAIAEDLGIDRTILTYLIDDLEKRDLVVRRPDPADRRSRLIVATETGRASREAHRAALEHVEAHVLASLEPEAAETLRGLLQRVACSAQERDPMSDLCEAVKKIDG
ncbi:putative MarR-family transcriptional regulator [Actinoplanes missouriensis 431]|uniref:Putative MarR-family transcriptional regulator n=1 Tax=Actinoplanes missouriensis (strain ATCC 14538 / DSM 43046 / CBS 188.64 / JCM 3121 / NBRC 102363 / NCIMB 12654 / NRRL B-3342 / UNCC 431) TaxID=512565 RepID=I0H825_ACTM4|nr:putative MarR-family transcriptional regulator [Actinoplanes missouriensis 431]